MPTVRTVETTTGQSLFAQCACLLAVHAVDHAEIVHCRSSAPDRKVVQYAVHRLVRGLLHHRLIRSHAPPSHSHRRSIRQTDSTSKSQHTAWTSQPQTHSLEAKISNTIEPQRPDIRQEYRTLPATCNQGSVCLVYTSQMANLEIRTPQKWKFRFWRSKSGVQIIAFKFCISDSAIQSLAFGAPNSELSNSESKLQNSESNHQNWSQLSKSESNLQNLEFKPQRSKSKFVKFQTLNTLRISSFENQEHTAHSSTRPWKSSLTWGC